MQNENNFEKHEKLKKKLKIAGFVLVIVGAGTGGVYRLSYNGR